MVAKTSGNSPRSKPASASSGVIQTLWVVSRLSCGGLLALWRLDKEEVGIEALGPGLRRNPVRPVQQLSVASVSLLALRRSPAGSGCGSFSASR